MHRILVIGVGSIGERHARCLLDTGRAHVGICEPNAELRQTIAQRYSLRDAFADLDQALQKNWDAAVIATPAPLHVSLAQQLAEQNVALLIEKPLAVDEKGIPELIQTIEQNQLPAAMAYVFRAHPAAQAIKQAIDEQRFGKPLELVRVGGQNFPWARPAYREIYYARRDQGGGLIQDGLTHIFNLCEWFVGPITRIAVDAARLALDGVDGEDTVHAIARHDESVLASYAANHYQAPNESFLKIVCEHGTMQMEMGGHLWKWMTEPGGTWREEPTGITERDQWFTRQEAAFLDYLEGSAPPLCTLREGWQTLRVNRAALASADHEGHWQRIEPLEVPS